jgi:hypothetical protein
MFFHTLRSNLNLERCTGDITPIISLLITIMMPSPDSGFDESAFSASSLTGGAGIGTLTEPLLVWLDGYGDRGEHRLHMFIRYKCSLSSDTKPVRSMVYLIHFGYFLEDMQKRFAQPNGSQGWEVGTSFGLYDAHSIPSNRKSKPRCTVSRQYQKRYRWKTTLSSLDCLDLMCLAICQLQVRIEYVGPCLA